MKFRNRLISASLVALLPLFVLLLGFTVVQATLTLNDTSVSSDGALTLKSASSSALTIGDPDQSGVITIASSTQALTLDIGKSTAVMTITIGGGSGGHTINIANGTSSAKTINIGTGTLTQNTINIGSASSTVSLGGNVGTGITDSATAIGFTLNTPSYSTSGSKIVSFQNNTVEKFAIDKDGRVITATVPSVRVTNSGIQSLNDNTLTALNFDTERFDTDGLHSTSTNNTRLTASVAGKYLIFATVTWDTNATGLREIAVKLNDTTYILDDVRSAVNGLNSFNSVAGVYHLAAGDYIELIGWQNSGGSLSSTVNANRSPEFGMVYTGP